MRDTGMSIFFEWVLDSQSKTTLPLVHSYLKPDPIESAKMYDLEKIAQNTQTQKARKLKVYARV